MFLNQINESISSRDTSINYLTGVWLQFQVENKQKTWKITSHLRFAAIFATKQNVATKRRASLDTSFQVCRVNGKLKQTNRQTTPANDKRLADVRRSTFPRCLISLIERLSTTYFFPANGRECHVTWLFPRLQFAGRRFYARRAFFPFEGNVKTWVFVAHFNLVFLRFWSYAFIAMLRLLSYFNINCL